jgi:2-(1,2-epoxy-1,2-dihydrophenyl)acetyl-CoA isomerase
VILTEVTDRIGLITMNRPHRRNALNGPLIVALDQAVKAMADDDQVEVVILTGAPAEGQLGGFCSGGDVKEGSRFDGQPPPGSEEAGVPADALAGDLARHDRQAPMLLHLMPKPTIAMVGGPAIGAGCSLAAACDLRYASEDAVFASSFSTNGLSGDYGGSFFWTRIIGTARARELYLLDERIPAARALELGMVNAVVPAAELRDVTWRVAERLVRTPASVLARIKDNLNQAEDEAERRRVLFAREATNQRQAVADRGR